MARLLTIPLFAAAALTMLPAAAFAQPKPPVAKAPVPLSAPWVIAPDIAYGYDNHFKTWQYKMGTNNAGLLLKGAKKVPKNTLFFLGANGQLYMRSGRFLEGDGSFMFGPS